MTEIIIVRHGETEWNARGIFRGRKDVTLSEVGIRQAELLGRRLSAVKLEAIYSSPLKRALATAARIAEYQPVKQVEVSKSLIDMDYGEWEGKSEREVAGLYGDTYEMWRLAPHQVRIPGGESLDDVRKRVISVIDTITSKHRGSVALVAHRVVNKVLICALLGLDNSHFWNIRQDNAGITIFSYEANRFILFKHNDTSHLREMQQHSLEDF
ncbi:MAG: histidine phosphatase family protein [Candidatus Bathyarchaeia archaeon]